MTGNSHLLLPSSPFQNVSIARFMFRPRFKSFRQLSPRAHRMMPPAAAFGFALAAAHWMIDRVHRHAPHVRAPSLPACPACFAARHVHVIDIADLTNRRITGLVNAPDFTRWHFYQTVTAFAVVQGRLLAGAARDLAAASWCQLDVVNVGAERNG